MRAEEIEELLAKVRCVPHFEGVTVRDIRGSVDARTVPQSMIVLPSHDLALPEISRQPPHERIEAIRIEAVGARQLPEEGTGFLTQQQHAAREEVARVTPRHCGA
jgi:hypothetical protein